ncbi:DUF3014 domain-containing protein [Aliiglaciecola sp. CAU 1673]|uniref:DUF3014 domain-containing protein n=1 Tax=Aliiglaciecola sp. CAU 1673 TaxID=3032595 RepID=UPI0023DAE476|nr:DUF3014 domain-containing protein [Aliiglaciecola sp. CAU 1673]MDF2179684.1 DUF3014 domain-containing protein [Aliiglaciecola sp. CAU 1673]
MSENESAPKKSMLPQLVIAIVLLAVVGVVFFLPEKEPERQPVPVLQEEVTTAPAESTEELPPEPEVIEPESDAFMPEAVATPEPLPALEPKPVDISDGAVKTAIVKLASYEPIARLIVDQELLRRFVVFADNLANRELAVNHQVLQPPGQEFKVYRQAGKEWIDSASYKRYTPYVEALESIETEQLINLYRLYEPAILEIFSEISGREGNFDGRLRAAINHLLDTPEVPMPVEVSTDSVMYKYVDPRLESLSAPQKQLLRTGPENMRIIKAKLREILTALNS